MPAKQDLFGQLWKEYAFSDSRYMTSDAFVVCMEAMTAVCVVPNVFLEQTTNLADYARRHQFLWGPMSFCVAFMITSEHPLRYPLQALVSLGQIYGLLLYYATSMFDLYHQGISYCRPEAYYFWVYFFFVNFIWIIIPGGRWLLQILKRAILQL